MRSRLTVAWSWFVVVGLFLLSGCAPPLVAWPGPTLDSPNVTRVCVRPPNVPPNAQWWGLSEGGQPLLRGWEVKIAQENGLRVYYFDSDAPPESAQSLPIPHNELKCPARILSAARILPLKHEVVAKARLEERPEAKEPKAAAEKPAAPNDPDEERFRQWAAEINKKKAPSTPPITKQTPMAKLARVASTACKELTESGQKRKRTSTSTCIRTKPLIHEVRAADPPPALVAVKPPKPLLEPVAPEYEDGQPRPTDIPGLDAERALECLNGVCHQRHQNFRPKGKTPAKPGDGQAWSDGGGPAPGSRSTVKTGTRPLSRPNGGQTKEGAPKPGRGGENPAAQRGREVHKEFKEQAKARGWRTEPQDLRDPSTGKKVVPDAITRNGNPVELKPRTPSGKDAGKRQMKKYEAATGKKGRVIYYDP